MRTRDADRTGFSLIEVVLSLGVIAFALVAILGVFPTGLSANRSGITDTRAGELVKAVTATIEAQCHSFGSIQCYGLTLDLGSLDKTSPAQLLYASFPSPDSPQITNTVDPGTIYTIELRFDNNPEVAPGVSLGTGKLNQIQIRVWGKEKTASSLEFFYLARNQP